MPEVKAFKGIYYNPKKVNIADVVAPLYDVISQEEEYDLSDRSDYNVVRLILSKEENRYEAAAKYFQQWKKANILIADDRPAIYILTQTFMQSDGKQVTCKGLIASCRIEETATADPQVETPFRSNEDHFNLLEETNVMFSPVFSLYNDPEFDLNDTIYNANSGRPFLEVEFNDILHRVWRVTDEKQLSVVEEFFKAKQALIGDGHQWYESAKAYRDVMKAMNASHTGQEAYNFVPMYFTNSYDPGLHLYPTHRILHSLPEFDPGNLIERLEEYFRVTIYSNQNQLVKNLPLRKNNLGLVLPTSIGYILLELKDQATVLSLGLPEELAKIDVCIMHAVIFKNTLGIGEESQTRKHNINYEQNIQYAIDIVREKRAQAAFLLNPIPIEQVREITDAGYQLPRKSIVFYPNLLSGLLMYSFLDE